MWFKLEIGRDEGKLQLRTAVCAWPLGEPRMREGEKRETGGKGERKRSGPGREGPRQLRRSCSR